MPLTGASSSNILIPMVRHGAEATFEQITLQGKLAEVSRIEPWISRLGAQYGIPGHMQYSMDLCLEEVISNIVLHGYGDSAGKTITIRCDGSCERGFVLTVDDEAPHFNPLEAPVLPALDAFGDIRVGGQGLRLLRKFADNLEYERKPIGNRLRIGFRANQNGST